jgi:hypothetical protein
MRIRFTKKDPRRGTIADLDATAAQRLIDSGNAEEVTGKAATTDADREVDEAGGVDTTTTERSAADGETKAARTRAPAKTAAKTTATRKR